MKMSSHVYMFPSIIADLHTCHIHNKSYIYVEYILIQPCGFTYMSHICYIYVTPSCSTKLYRGYYTVAWRYEFYFQVAKQYFTNERSESEWVTYCFCHEKIKIISSSCRVMFFLLYGQKDINKIKEGNYRDYVIDKLTCEIMENKPLASRM